MLEDVSGAWTREGYSGQVHAAPRLVVHLWHGVWRTIFRALCGRPVGDAHWGDRQGTGRSQPPGSLAQDARASGFEKALAAKYPNINYLGAQYQSNDPQRAAEIITSTLSAHPDLAGVFSTNDQGAIGAITGLRQAGAVGQVKMVAYDAASAEVAALKNGEIQALIAQNPKLEGEVAMEVAAKLIAGETVEAVTMTEIVAITADQPELADKYEYIADCM